MKFGGPIDMLHGSLWDKVLAFTLPLVATALLQQLYNGADLTVLGQFVGKQAMAAVGNDIPVVGLFLSLLLGLSLGGNVVVAQLLGGGKYKEASKAVHTAFALSLIIGVLLLIVGQVFAVPALHLLGVPKEILPEAELYMRIYFSGVPFVSLYNFQAALFRSRGEVTIPLAALFVASMLNIVLDLISVTVFDLGLAGVAGATVIANMTASGILFFALYKRNDVLSVRIKDLTFHKEHLKRMLSIGMPAGIQGMVFSVANLIIQMAINSLGPDAMAASAASFILEINVYVILMSFGQATTTFVGQNFGARQIHRCRQVTTLCMKMSVAVFVVMAAFVYVKGEAVLHIFTSDPAVIELGLIRIHYVVELEILNICMEVLSGAMRGYGFSLPPAIVTLIGICAVRIIWVYTVFAANPGFSVLMMIYPISWGITTVLLFALYRWYMHRLTGQLKGICGA